ncbi:helix-hairpin-helix domain-containing protein [Amycolatopsis sp. NBC_01307]|nr:helix-hairpin-helix domain-containing protein [Amycolatopsis sp. NBC_01307]
MRLGLAGVRTVGETVADTIVAERQAHGPYTSIDDLTRRIQLTKTAVEALATAGAFSRFSGDRRPDLQAAGVAATRPAPGICPGSCPTSTPPALPGMTRFEVTAAGRIWQCRPRIRTRLGRCCEREVSVQALAYSSAATQCRLCNDVSSSPSAM